jgi:hypothetical protein
VVRITSRTTWRWPAASISTDAALPAFLAPRLAVNRAGLIQGFGEYLEPMNMAVDEIRALLDAADLDAAIARKREFETQIKNTIGAIPDRIDVPVSWDVADIDLPRLAATHKIDRRLHVVVNATRRHAAEHPERMPVRVEQHLVGLQGIGPQKEGPAVRQLDMGDLQLHAIAADNRIVLAPIKLERLAGAEGERNKGAAPRGLLLALPLGGEDLVVSGSVNCDGDLAEADSGWAWRTARGEVTLHATAPLAAWPGRNIRVTKAALGLSASDWRITSCRIEFQSSASRTYIIGFGGNMPAPRMTTWVGKRRRPPR